jgi:hypothetical protein
MATRFEITVNTLDGKYIPYTKEQLISYVYDKLEEECSLTQICEILGLKKKVFSSGPGVYELIILTERKVFDTRVGESVVADYVCLGARVIDLYVAGAAQKIKDANLYWSAAAIKNIILANNLIDKHTEIEDTRDYPLREIINLSFSWFETEEGEDFWSDIYENLTVMEDDSKF